MSNFWKEDLHRLINHEIIDKFISKEIESAIKAERERIVEALEGLKLETDIFYSKCTPIQALDQVINLINK